MRCSVWLTHRNAANKLKACSIGCSRPRAYCCGRLSRVATTGEGVAEQIDGVIELDGEIYLVEMKWWNKPLGPGEVSQHLVRVFSRNCARGLLISYSDFTDPGVTICKESLACMVVTLCGCRISCSY